MAKNTVDSKTSMCMSQKLHAFSQLKAGDTMQGIFHQILVTYCKYMYLTIKCSHFISNTKYLFINCCTKNTAPFTG